MPTRPRKQPLSNALRHGEGSIRKIEDRYQARWYDEDGRARSKRFNTQEAAEDHLRTIFRLKNENRYVSPSDLTVEALVRTYLERTRSYLSSATYATYEQRARGRIYPDIGWIKCVDLTTPKVQLWIDKLGRGRRPWSPQTIHGTHLVLLAAFEEARRMGIVSNNPASGVRLPRTRAKAHQTWSPTEISRVFAHVAEDPLWHAVYRVALLTGMRPGELRALKWKELFLDSNYLIVRRTITKGDDGRPTLGETTKSKQTRTVALTGSCIDALKAWQTRQKVIRLAAPEWEHQDFVFTNARGGYLSATTWTKYHREMIRSLEITPITLHEMRHTAATVLLSSGASVKLVSEILGHSKIQTTLDLYVHVTAQDQRRAVDHLDQLVSGTFG